MDRELLPARHFLLVVGFCLAACSSQEKPPAPRLQSAKQSRAVVPELVLLAGGQKIAVRHYGTPGGFPLFFFHGWPSDASQAVLLDAVAKENGFHVLAPDRPGFGRSDPQPNRRLTDWPRVVAEIADHYHHRRFAVMGVSGGGPYALVTGWALPRRVTSVTAISCATPLAESSDPSEFAPLYRALLGAYKEHPDALRQFFRAGRSVVGLMPNPLWWLATRGLPAPDRAALADPTTFSTVFSGVRQGWRSGHDGVFEDAALNAQPWGFPLNEIRVPVVFWHGVEDRNFRPSAVRRVASQVPGASLHVVENEGHFSLPLRRADSIVAAVRR